MTPDLHDLEEKIRAVEESRKPEENQAPTGMHAGMEFVGAIVFGTAIGLALDSWLGTKPLFFLSLFALGIVTGFYNVYKISQGTGTGVGFSRLHQRKKSAKTTPEQKREEQDLES